MEVSDEMMKKYKKYNIIKEKTDSDVNTYRSNLLSKRLACFDDGDMKEIYRTRRHFYFLYTKGNILLFIGCMILSAVILTYFVDKLLNIRCFIALIMGIILILLALYCHLNDYKKNKRYKEL